MEILEKAYFDSGHDISFMLETLFKSEFFKSEDCHYKKIKSPAELVAGVLRTTEEFQQDPRIEINEKTNHKLCSINRYSSSC